MANEETAIAIAPEGDPGRLKYSEEKVRSSVNGDDWSEPAPLDDMLPRVPPFDLEILPPSLRPLVEDVSERMQTPADFAAISAIVSLAGCVNRRAIIRPKARDTTWEVVPNLWGAIVAPPGYMKSPVLQAVALPLTRIEELWRANHATELAKFAIQQQKNELEMQVWREQYKAAVKNNLVEPARPSKSFVEPLQKRLIVTDATVEKLHLILSQNPAGILVLRDELTGWLAELEREGREGERAFFLQAWGGDASFTMDRIARGSIYVSAVCVSLLGLIQPARLRAYLSGALEYGPSDDGLFQRFQLLVWPDAPRDWRLVDRLPNNAAFEMAANVFSGLADLSAEDPLRLRFAPSAQQLFFEWWCELENKIRGDSAVAPAIIAHLSKYRSLMPTIAGLFELADRVVRRDLNKKMSISLTHAKQAAAMCDYLEGHARRVYSCIVTPEFRASLELGLMIQRNTIRRKFRLRDVYRMGRTGLDTPDRVRAALSVLEDAAWVRHSEIRTSPSGGRPTEEWYVNPKVRVVS